MQHLDGTLPIRNAETAPGLTIYANLVYLCMPKQRRHELIAHHLRLNEALTQQDLVELLTQAGESVTQATVSRDLSALGATKGPDGYKLSAGGHTRGLEIDQNLTMLVRTHAFTIELAHNIVVIKTAPGHAQLLAVGFDRNPPKGLMGCLAGDDTIFLATQSPKTAKQVQTLLREHMKSSSA